MKMMSLRRVGAVSHRIVPRVVVNADQIVVAPSQQVQLPFLASAPVSAPPLVAEVSFSDFIDEVKNSRQDIERVEIAQDGSELRAYMKDGEFPTLQVFLPQENIQSLNNSLISTLLDSKLPIRIRRAAAPPWFDIQNMITMFFEFFLIFVIGRMFFASLGIGGGAGGIQKFAESSAKLDEEPNTGVSFADVAGCDNAKRDLMETVDFLKNPAKYAAIGAKMPKGVLMVGPPGTGKTRLARAVAGEAGVPFFSCSGSEFIEMFVGVGSARVRSLFKRAQEKSPCIIFIDEVDAIGKKRGAGMFGGSHEEHDQTINQLLTMMDGFTPSSGVVVIAATNRPEVLDDALLRPGRFDRRVYVDLPDVVGREAILTIHTKNKRISSTVDLHKIAKITVGFSGADLENLCNEACINAARSARGEVNSTDFDQALEKLTIGEERRTTLFTDAQRELIAYHEAGHALMGIILADAFDKIRKVSIVPRGPAGGITYFEPAHENGLATRAYLENQIVVALGGRVAEELIFGLDAVTNGAAGDFQRVTEIARDMIVDYGFSTTLAPMSHANTEGLAAEVDAEINNLVLELYDRTRNLMIQHEATLHALAAELLQKETLHEDDIAKYFHIM